MVTTKKLSSNQLNPGSLHFPMFTAKCHECKHGKRDGHGKSRNGHGKVMENNYDNALTDTVLRHMNSVRLVSSEVAMHTRTHRDDFTGT